MLRIIYSYYEAKCYGWYEIYTRFFKWIREGFKKFNVYLSTQELLTLTDELRKDNKGDCSMEDLYNLIVCYK